MANNALAKREQSTELATESRQQVEAARPASNVTFTPRCDIVELEDELVLYADLPGVRPDDVDVRFESGELTIHGKCQPRQAGAGYLAQEYGVGDFFRAFSIGESIDAGRIAADFKQGVLMVHLPKAEAAKPKRIAIRSE